jgi:LysM repeat protein
MSRDAKVGLVIVFSLVFIFGSVLVRRLQSASEASETTLAEAGAAAPETTAAADLPATSGTRTDTVQVRTIDAVEHKAAPSAGSEPGAAAAGATASSTAASGSSAGGPAGSTAEPPPPPAGVRIVLSGENTSRSAEALANAGSTVERTPQAEAPAAEAVSPAASASVPAATGSPDSSSAPAAAPAESPGGSQAPDDSTTTMPSPDRVPPLASIRLQTPPTDASVTTLPADSVAPASGTGSPPSDAGPPAGTSDPARITVIHNETAPRAEAVTTTPNSSQAMSVPEPPTPPTRMNRPVRQEPPPVENISSAAGGEVGGVTYVVKEGDSFWTISQAHYGTPRFFRAIEQYNAARLPPSGSLRAGMKILLPDKATLQRADSPAPATRTDSAVKAAAGASDASPTRRTPAKTEKKPATQEQTVPAGMYRVKSSDTLSTIAQRELGSASRWRELYELNRQQIDNPDRLRAGTLLRLPSARPREKVAERTKPRR